MASKLL
jgi:hypothetical protein